MTARRGFLKALVAATAVAAVTAVVPEPTRAAPVKVVEVVKERLVWPEMLPRLVGRPETDDEQDARLLQMLIDAEREVFRVSESINVTWNGLTFRLARGPNVVPKPIADVYRQAQQDAAVSLFGERQEQQARLARKFSHTFGGGP